ncbi:MAG: acyl-CoA dehydrogenase family protein [Myxococcota bacterium]|nr:acyl-CoA dehydrogenase family protein [Myxococcota bacterium]
MFTLSQVQEDTRDVAQSLAASHLSPASQTMDRNKAFPGDTLRTLGAQGLLGVNIEAGYGGRAAGVMGYVQAVRQLAAACAGTTVAMMVTNMVAEAIQAYGSPEQKDYFLPRICGGDWPAASFSLSEPGSGSDAASLRTIAERDGDSYVLTGTKSWVTSGGHAGVYLVMAATDPSLRSRGISSFLIEPGTAGFSAGPPEEKMGLRSSTTTELILDECRVHESRRLGPEGIGFKIAMNALDGGRVGVSAQACGVAEAAIGEARRFVADATHANDARQTQWQTLLGESEAELEAGWLLCLRAAQLKDLGKKLTRQAAVSKLYCTEMANRVCDRTLRIMGHAGCDGAARAQQLARDVRVTRIYEGTSEVQRIVIAREVLRSMAQRI